MNRSSHRFSTARGLLENLDAHLHGGRTPRDRPVTLPPSPLSFGGRATMVIDHVDMLDPQIFKKVNPSPSGKPTTGVASNISRPGPHPIDGGDSATSSSLWYETEVVFICRELGSGKVVDVDSAHALEKYITDWSLANKDRIMDALSAKMALFHLGTHAEHAYYRKMSGPEIGNALMLNKAQSNSLVVETYKRLVEAKSNYRRFEREVASLKNEDNVSEAREVNISSQASVVAAHEARDKALQDLEDFKFKFGGFEKRLSDVEEKGKAELKETWSSYNQLLADHHRLINGTFAKFPSLFCFLGSFFKSPFLLDKVDLERARDRAVESHLKAVSDMKDMLSRYDREMVELYGLSSELLLTKQWFLTDGVVWVVKLVQQSPELEKVVADLVNSVNAVGVNDDIKQGFQAAKDLARSAEEVLGYDEGAKDALDVASKAFDDFHISVLDRVSELVNEPLSVIKQRSELSIVKED
ncbi:hypothetical protein Hanom_Chr06g00557521 [Helianthus anomalus]